MKCPQCGYSPKRGRPKKLDDQKILELKSKGLSLRQIAKELNVSHSAIRWAIKRTGQ